MRRIRTTFDKMFYKMQSAFGRTFAQAWRSREFGHPDKLDSANLAILGSNFSKSIHIWALDAF